MTKYLTEEEIFIISMVQRVQPVMVGKTTETGDLVSDGGCSGCSFMHRTSSKQSPVDPEVGVSIKASLQRPASPSQATFTKVPQPPKIDPMDCKPMGSHFTSQGTYPGWTVLERSRRDKIST